MASALAQIVTDVITRLNDPALTSANVVTGRRETESNNDAPRVVFCYQGGPIVPPDRVGHGLIDTTTRARIIEVRNCAVLVECHGQTEEQAEEMLHAVVRAVRNALHNSVQFGDESWPDQDEGADSFDKRGALVTFTFTMNLPIYDVDHPLTIVTGVQEGTDTFDGEAIPCNV